MRTIILLLCSIFIILVSSGTKARANSKTLDGVWFTCEFTQSQTPPDDGCLTFDDEGFRFADGKATYLRMNGSEEKGCKGNKKGQCFARDRSDISVSTRSLGKISYGVDWIDIRYLFCTQRFHIGTADAYLTLKPDAKRCPWAGKRHFYIAPFDGTVRYD